MPVLRNEQTPSHLDSLEPPPPPPPPITARFFYISPIPIDDPLSPLPPPSSTAVPVRQNPQPFSRYDDAALEKAWQELRRGLSQRTEEKGEESVAAIQKRPNSSSGNSGASASDTVLDVRKAQNTKISPSGLAHAGSKTDLKNMGSELDQHMADASHSVFEFDGQPDTTGTPFIRAPSRTEVNTTNRERPARPKLPARDTYSWEDDTHLAQRVPVPQSLGLSHSPIVKVPVGVSRLHQVEMPDLEMTPIYWEPVHDEAPVIRSTWFYKETMLPVETKVANMLEAGYVDLRVWTDTWKDELRSAVAVGSLGEEKIVHKLWPDRVSAIMPTSWSAPSATRAESKPQSRSGLLGHADEAQEIPDAARDKVVDVACAAIDASTVHSGYDNKASGHISYSRSASERTFANYGVIYANDREARLLKPSLMPSEYYGRRRLAHYLARGRQIGISVVRGFDQKAWDKLHPPREDSKMARAESGATTSASGVSPQARHRSDPALAKSERPQVSDLVLVVHGIGQKLSQRMESWHFTHAMNAFRREVNVEMGSKEVNASFRDNMGGIMVLPVNWRHSLSLEDGGYQDGPKDTDVDGFSLDDITPDTLPSVRNIVSDVMLDIPYYMSHHQPKMIAAVISEANRVYKLWCRNNPGFAEHGRVHIIAHSLGSVMAIDILSRQPTKVPSELADPTSNDLPLQYPEHFLFNTANLFLAGSPAGFFLLLRKAQLKPRIDHESAAATFDPSSNTSAICGERGQYGCIAVENVYNIINGYDPVAYRMNATVDATYADSLKKATIPSAASGWFGRRESSFWFPVSNGSMATSHKPSLPRLPSTVEMETHNFTREEIAEKRMYLLNDNGQIDYYVRYGGGPLEIQYLTMLSAHSSYWLLRDFTRMIVLEIGRARGRDGALLNMRAVKKKAQFT